MNSTISTLNSRLPFLHRPSSSSAAAHRLLPSNSGAGRRAGCLNARLNPTCSLVPMVVERTSVGERSYDIFSRLLKDRIICVNGDIDDGTTQVVVAQLLFLEKESSVKPIYMYINSPGGSVSSGLAIYDTMQNVNSPVHTICVGQAASMGSLLLAGGAKGKRMALPNATIMIHQPWGGVQGKAKDMSIHTRHINRLFDKMNAIYAKHTGQPIDVIEKNMDRDNYMSAEEAKEFGLIDEVFEQKPVDLVTGAFDPETPLGGHRNSTHPEGEISTATA